ncbi:hypothetical protein AB3S75_012782 [Citrus x aurantiifolia]
MYCFRLSQQLAPRNKYNFRRNRGETPRVKRCTGFQVEIYGLHP